jgi:hypothetical protein
MSLDARQERRLRRMARDLAGSAPSLASMLTLFNRLVLTEDMPAGHEVVGGGREKWTGAEGWVVMVVALVVIGAVVAVLVGSSHTADGRSQLARCARIPVSACTTQFSIRR